jgi:TonB family protein
MRYFLFSLLFGISITYTQAQPNRPNYSYDQLFDLDHAGDTTYYPTLPLSEEFKARIRQVACYPELLKKRKVNREISFILEVDTTGKITEINHFGVPEPAADTNAMRVLMASSGHWIPALRKKNKVNVTIKTSVFYAVTCEKDGKLRYTVSIMGMKPMIVDSSLNVPPVLRFKEEENSSGGGVFFTEREFDGSKVILADRYGTVTVAFDVDTAGHLSNIGVEHGVTSDLDEHALKFIRSTEGQWSPACKDGIKRENHVEFDMKYYQLARVPGTGAIILAQVGERAEAMRLFEEKDYTHALNKLERLSKYYIRDAEIFFLRGMVHLHLEDQERACDHIRYSLFLADQYGYPAIMDREKTKGFVNEFCN